MAGKLFTDFLGCVAQEHHGDGVAVAKVDLGSEVYVVVNGQEDVLDGGAIDGNDPEGERTHLLS